MGRGDNNGARITLDELLEPRSARNKRDRPIHRQEIDGQIQVDRWIDPDTGELHNDDGPARIVTEAGFVTEEDYFQQGQLHCEFAAAKTRYYPDGRKLSEHWYENGELVDGPSGWTELQRLNHFNGVPQMFGLVRETSESAEIIRPHGNAKYDVDRPSLVQGFLEGEAIFEAFWINENGSHRDDDMPATVGYHDNGLPRFVAFADNGAEHRKRGPAKIDFYKNGTVSSLMWMDRDKVVAEVFFNEDGTVSRDSRKISDDGKYHMVVTEGIAHSEKIELPSASNFLAEKVMSPEIVQQIIATAKQVRAEYPLEFEDSSAQASG